MGDRLESAASGSLAVVVGVGPNVNVHVPSDFAVPHPAQLLSLRTLAMSDLCPVYAPFFGAMVGLPAQDLSPQLGS